MLTQLHGPTFNSTGVHVDRHNRANFPPPHPPPLSSTLLSRIPPKSCDCFACSRHRLQRRRVSLRLQRRQLTLSIGCRCDDDDDVHWEQINIPLFVGWRLVRRRVGTRTRLLLRRATARAQSFRVAFGRWRWRILRCRQWICRPGTIFRATRIE